jgi:hypothetical protein
MEENVGLFAVNRYVGRCAFSNWIWWGCDILVVLVVFERLGGIGLDGLPGIRGQVYR